MTLFHTSFEKIWEPKSPTWPNFLIKKNSFIFLQKFWETKFTYWTNFYAKLTRIDKIMCTNKPHNLFNVKFIFWFIMSFYNQLLVNWIYLQPCSSDTTEVFFLKIQLQLSTLLSPKLCWALPLWLNRSVLFESSFTTEYFTQS